MELEEKKKGIAKKMEKEIAARRDWHKEFKDYSEKEWSDMRKQREKNEKRLIDATPTKSPFGKLRGNKTPYYGFDKGKK